MTIPTCSKCGSRHYNFISCEETEAKFRDPGPQMVTPQAIPKGYRIAPTLENTAPPVLPLTKLGTITRPKKGG